MGYKHSTLKSFSYAFSGIKTALKEEPNFKIHIAIATIVFIFAYVLKLAPLEWLTLVLTISMVLILELVNTSLEALIDIVSPQIQEKARIAKDVAAASVLVASICAIIVGFVIFLPKILSLLTLTR